MTLWLKAALGIVAALIITSATAFALSTHTAQNSENSGMVASTTEEGNANTAATSTVQSNPSTSAPVPVHPTPGHPIPTRVLTISSITPTSGSTGTVVTITGTGFNATSQVVIGAGAIHPTINTTGTKLTFTMPNSIGAYCKAGQACPMWAMLLRSGTYSLSVKNDDGSQSNSVDFTLMGGDTLE